MSKSLLYHGFGIPSSFEYKRTSFHQGRIQFTIQRYLCNCKCSICGSYNVKPRGIKTRTLRTVPIGKKIVEIIVNINRLECLDCHIIRQERIEIADRKRTYTHAFERLVIDLSQHMTIKDVALYLKTSWDIVKDIQKRNLKKKFSRPNLKSLKYIAIDEISVRKGHKYLTIVMDLLSGKIVYVGDGKGADSLQDFWKRLKRSKAYIEAVSIDMSPAYIEAVQTNLSHAAIVFDHFHVVKLFNDKLSKLRCKLHRELNDGLQKETLKGTRWLLLKNPENLDNEKNEKQRLEEALELNKPLATAYYMKEDLRQIWSQDNKENAKIFIKDWIKRARASGIQILKKFANTLSAHASGILAYYDHKISTGPLEGMNNKIKTMKRQAYGFRDLEFFKLKIYALHQTKYALIG